LAISEERPERDAVSDGVAVSVSGIENTEDDKSCIVASVGAEAGRRKTKLAGGFDLDGASEIAKLLEIRSIAGNTTRDGIGAGSIAGNEETAIAAVEIRGGGRRCGSGECPDCVGNECCSIAEQIQSRCIGECDVTGSCSGALNAECALQDRNAATDDICSGEVLDAWAGFDESKLCAVGILGNDSGVGNIGNATKRKDIGSGGATVREQPVDSASDAGQSID
jgi:hypothetical protein